MPQARHKAYEKLNELVYDVDYKNIITIKKPRELA
jgi:hypothetical protein